jgi:hypothetical protein
MVGPGAVNPSVPGRPTGAAVVGCLAAIRRYVRARVRPDSPGPGHTAAPDARHEGSRDVRLYLSSPGITSARAPNDMKANGSDARDSATAPQAVMLQIRLFCAACCDNLANPEGSAIRRFARSRAKNRVTFGN